MWRSELCSRKRRHPPMAVQCLQLAILGPLPRSRTWVSHGGPQGSKLYWKFRRRRPSPAGCEGANSCKAVIKNADMAEDMQQDAIDCATQDQHSPNQATAPNAANCALGTAPSKAGSEQLLRPQALEKYNIEKDIAAFIKKDS